MAKEVTLDEIKEDAIDKHMSKIIVLDVNQLGVAKVLASITKKRSNKKAHKMKMILLTTCELHY